MENMQISKENDNTLANKKQNTEIYDANGNVITVDNIKNILEKDLIQRAINGEKNAFNELYTKSYRYVLFVTKQYISNDETAYDAIQETFIKVYKGIKKLRSPDAFYGWISTIAKNTAIDIMRAAHYEVNISYEENDETIANKERNYDISLDVQSVLKKLSADDTKILSLVYYDGLRVSQIAKMQGVPATTVYSRLNKAKKNLKAQLAIRGIDTALYGGNFVAMITTALRNIIGTALLSFAVAQQMLDSIINGKNKKEFAIAKIIRSQQKKAILKIASVIVAISMVTTAFTVGLLEIVDKYIEETSYDLPISVESSFQTEREENIIESDTGFTNEEFDKHSSPVTDTDAENTFSQGVGGESSVDIVTDPIVESTPKEETFETITVPNIFGNANNNVMYFYEDSFSPIGCPIAKNSDYIYYSDDTNIFKVDLNNSKKTVIYSSKETTPLCYDLNLVGDYLYFVDGGIKRIKTDGSELKTIYNDYAFNLLVRGNTGWFVSLDNPTSTAMLTKYDLFQIDLQTGETIRLVENASGLGLKIVLEDKLIYANGDTVYQKNLSNGTQEQLYKIQNTENSYYVGFDKMCINGGYIYLLENNLSYESRETIIVKIDLNAPNKTYVYNKENGYSIYDMYGYINGYGLSIAYNTTNGAKKALITTEGIKYLDDCNFGMCKVFMFEGDDYIYIYDTESRTIQRELPDGSQKHTF